MSSGLDIHPKERSDYVVEGSTEYWAARLKSDDDADRVEAAWHLMQATDPVPISLLREGLDDSNPDVRWYLTEALQKCLDDDAISLAGKMLRDDDQFVRIGAGDALVLAGESALRTLWNSVAGSISASSRELFADVKYAIGKISMEDKSRIVRLFIGSEGGRIIAHTLQEAAGGGYLDGVLRRHIWQLRDFFLEYDTEDGVLFSEAIRLLVPELMRGCGEGTKVSHAYAMFLEGICRRGSIAAATIREIADSLGIDSVEIPRIRVAEVKQEFLQQVVQAALIGMSLRGKARILVLFMLHLHGSDKLVELSARVLLEIGISEAVEVMTQMAAQKRALPDRVINAVDILRQIEPSIEESSWANMALDQIAGAAAVPVLIEALRDESGEVRRSAIRALGQIGDVAGVPALIEAFEDDNPYTRKAAFSAVEQIGQAAIPGLIETLRKNGRSFRRAYAAMILGRIGDTAVVPVLIEVLRDRDARVRASVAGALGAIGDPAVVPVLTAALGDEDVRVRYAAAGALGAVGDPDTVPVLVRALGDKYSTVRLSAVRALQAIGAPTAVPALAKTLADRNARVRSAAGKALRSMGMPEAIEAVAEGGLK